MQECDVLIIGAGAAGLFCAIEAAKRQRRVIVIDHANKAGKKILMSGGGRCNFTNYNVSPDKYLSHNPHFCKSALSRYTQWDFIELVKKYNIRFHEKTLGQLFCDGSSKEILNLLLSQCQQYHVQIELKEPILSTNKIADHFQITTNKNQYICQSLVIACGGLSIPTMGASAFGYQIAEQFNIKVWPLRAGLVPITLHQADKEKLSPLSGISCESIVSSKRMQFRENILFTHRGLSGPAILQISNYWQPGDALTINFSPTIDIFEELKSAQKQTPKRLLKNILEKFFPKRFVNVLFSPDMLSKTLHDISNNDLQKIVSTLQVWTIKPNGTEGYRTAEVTIGGVDCDALSSKTMEAVNVKGLYFIGEVVDVTGWLGGYNFQWAWSSGWAAGQVV
ncbi:MAG: NAD(P)/FAD-dependent oxidoreductase [Proteobacteria bacterium]|nr:NAD(P)/FAD-dependent oxidoreductase [Pseudomonadota bacterium]